MKRFFNSFIGKHKKEPILYFNTIDISEAITNAENDNNMLKIVPIGSFPNHHQGPFVITQKEIDEMMKNGKKAGTDVLVDYGHDSNWNMGAVAAGWSPKQKLEARTDGLYMQFPTFTEAAQEKIDNKEYRYLSPVFTLCTKDKKGKEIGARLFSVGLVNRPFFDKEIDHIGNTSIKFQNINQENNNNEDNEMLNEIILKFFGLEEGATLEDVETKINIDELKNLTFADLQSAAKINCEECEIAKADAKKNSENDGDNDDDEKTKLNSKIETLQKEIDELKKVNTDKQTEKAEQLINQAINDGKILPADKEVWLNSALKDYDDTKTKLDAKKSTLPKKITIENSLDINDTQAVANAARKLVDKEAKEGNRISFSEAVNRVKKGES